MSQFTRQSQQSISGQSAQSPAISGVQQLSQSHQSHQSHQLQQTQINAHKRYLQQFYLHKSFDLSSDAEFLPSIPSDPIAAAIQVQESMKSAIPNMPPQYLNHAIQRSDQMSFYGQAAQKSRRHSGQFLHQHLFGGKRNDYVQHKQGP